MVLTPDNLLYTIKQLVTGLNGDDTPVAGGLLPGQGATNSSAKSADGGIKVDQPIPLQNVAANTAFPVITDSTGGTASTTFAAITAGSSYAQADMVAVKNALAEIAKVLNAANVGFAGTVSSAAALTIASGSSPSIGTVSFPIPRDYDEASDHLAIRLMAKLANADASITVTGTATVLPIATGTAATKSAVTGTAPFSTASLALTTTEQVVDINLSGYGLKRDDTVTVALALAGTTTGNTYVFAIEKSFESCIVSYNDTDATQSPNGTTAIVQPGFGNPLR